MRGYAKHGVPEAIRAAGGEIYAITSEPQSLARNAQEGWETGIEHVGDPHQEIPAACRDRGWISLFTQQWGGSFTRQVTWASHPKGYLQPGVLALTRSSRVLYRWRSRPTRRNVGGAVARPTPEHVWGRVQAALAEPDDAPDAGHDDDPVLDTRPVPWPLFVATLISNGWFWRPKAFDYRAEGPSVRSRQLRALARLPLFVAAWVAAFVWLPWWIPTLALAAWLAKIVPEIRELHVVFQNVGPDEEPA